MKRPLHRQLMLEPRPTLPSWKSLPAECREELMRLLVGMLREHRAQVRAAASAKEVHDE